MMLIGSQALSCWDSSFPLKATADYDIITEESFSEGYVEKHDPHKFLNKHVLEQFGTKQTISSLSKGPVVICSPRGLAAIKRSHLSVDWFWEKHITQYHKHLKKHLRAEDWTFVKEREKLTHEAVNQSNPSLKQSNEAFFDDAVEKRFDHDWLHELVAYYKKPLYTQLKRDFTKAWCEEDLWESLSYEDKCRCVAEEAHVIAAERFLIPSEWEAIPKLSYFKALRKICTTLTSGWFRDFAIDNYPTLMYYYRPEALNKVKEHTYV